MPIITLLTDFGLKDWFVGTMKGVIAGISPRAEVIDITHEIPPGDIRAGAFALKASYCFFPKGTVHVAVVDPGVGSTRKAIGVRTANYCFIAPDNGVLSWALQAEGIRAMHTLENDKYFLKPISHTFHGRDIFAPVAAHLAKGLPLRKLGPAFKNYMRLPWSLPRQDQNRIQGEVIYLDRFGNAITNIGAKVFAGAYKSVCEIEGTKRHMVCPVKSFYQSVGPGTTVAMIGSSGLLEIAVNNGSAEKLLGLEIGTKVTVRG